ncbi:hypothetical protein [Streptomyces sp. NPDC058701]
MGIVEANYSVQEDRTLSGLAKRMHPVRGRRKQCEEDGGRPGA